MLRPCDRSEPGQGTDDDPVSALADALLASPDAQVQAWRHAGVVYANHLIDYHRDQVGDELFEANLAWDAPCPAEWADCMSSWVALVAGYRDTLREYVERGNDV